MSTRACVSLESQADLWHAHDGVLAGVRRTRVRTGEVVGDDAVRVAGVRDAG